MKKITVLFLVMIISCFVLTGCTKKEEGKLLDEYAPFEFTFKYPKEGYEFKPDLTNTKYVKGDLINEDKNFVITFKFSDKSEAGINNSIKANKDRENFKKTNYTSFGGYEYYDKNDYYGVSLLDEKSSEDQNYALIVSIKKKNYTKELDFKELIESKDFKNIMKSINFRTDITGKKLDGVLSDNHKILVKYLKDGDDYTVKQYPESLAGVMNSYRLKDDKSLSSGANFRVEYSELEKTYKNMDGVLGHRKEIFNDKYEDADLYGLKVKQKMDDYTNSMYSRYSTGFFEKDGKIFSYYFTIYKNTKDEIAKKLVNDVINNMEIYDATK